jgi:hypothetical protein
MSRASDENMLAALVARLLGEQLDRVIVNPDWPAEDKILAEALWPVILDIAKRAARRELMIFHKERALRTAGGIWDRILEWVMEYTFDEFVPALNENTRQMLSRAIQEYVSNPQSIGDLRDALAPIFGADRAMVIAVTETTRAYAQGGAKAADELRESGLDIVDIWHTANDDLVCDLCDHEGEARGEGWTEDPPAHPNCRCRVGHQVG